MAPEEPGRPLAPLGRRPLEVVSNVATGGYRIFTLNDAEGPEPAPGQFYMLATAEWEGEGGRPFLPRAVSVARTVTVASGTRLEFLVESVGPGTDRLCRAAQGERVWAAGPYGRPFSSPRALNASAAGAILVGGGIGIAPLAMLRRRFSRRGVPARALLGFRDREHSGGVEELFGCEEVRLASEDGHAGHRGYVTDLLARMFEGDDTSGAVVYSCGPPAMLEAVRLMCAEAGVPVELALESPMACGFGACFGCAVPKVEGGYLRLCVDGPVVRGDQVATAMAGEAA